GGSGPAADAADQPGRDRHRLQPQAHGHTHAAASEPAAVGPEREPTPRSWGPPEALSSEKWSRSDTESPISYPNATSSRCVQCRDRRRRCKRSDDPATGPPEARSTREPGAPRG